MDYKNTKGGVDTVDKLCASYDCARNTREWTRAIFFCLLNVLGINTMVIHKFNRPNNMRGREFLRNSSFQLVENHLRNPAQLTCLPRLISSKIRELIEYQKPKQRLASVNENNVLRRGCYGYCDRKKIDLPNHAIIMMTYLHQV